MYNEAIVKYDRKNLAIDQINQINATCLKKI